MPNPIIGEWVCPVGGKIAKVSQTKKAGSHFNTYCSCCKFQQGTGEDKQNRIYREAKFYDGVEVIKPANIDDNWKQKATEPAAKVEPKAATESQASSDDLTEKDLLSSVAENAPEAKQSLGVKRKTDGFRVVGLLLLAACGLGAIWTSV